MKLICFLFLFLPVAIFAQTLTGKVVGIADGDTFTLLLDGKDSTVRVRLYGVDCPEKHQDYGTKAKQFISELIFKRLVRVEQKDFDRYGRIVGMVFLDTLNINEALLKSGFAWHYVRYDKDNPKWDAIEAEARQEKRGLWQMPNPTPPWEFRRNK